MASFRTIPNASLNTIAKEIGSFVPPSVANSLGMGSPGASPELAESIDIWSLKASSVLDSASRLSKAAAPTGRWHHQIRISGVPAIYAESHPTGPDPDDWHVDAVFSSDLAGQIQEAMEWIDANRPESDISVRLLISAAYHLHAFWLLENGTSIGVVVISSAHSDAFEERNKIYSDADFLLRLRSLSHSEGIVE